MSGPDVMSSRPGFITLAATELLYGHGARSGIAPPALQEYLRAREGMRYLSSRAWCQKVYVPACTHLLLPRIGVPVTVEYPKVGNPVRVTAIDGVPVAGISDQAAVGALAPYTVAVSLSAATALWAWLGWLTHRGVPQDVATLALTAGLDHDEALVSHRAGTLTRETLLLMHALADPAGPSPATVSA